MDTTTKTKKTFRVIRIGEAPGYQVEVQSSLNFSLLEDQLQCVCACVVLMRVVLELVAAGGLNSSACVRALF